MKQEALRLADWLLRENTQLTVDSAYMIRKLVDEIDKLEDIKNDYAEREAKFLRPESFKPLYIREKEDKK